MSTLPHSVLTRLQKTILLVGIVFSGLLCTNILYTEAATSGEVQVQAVITGNTPLVDVTNFAAVYQQTENRIQLTWTAPTGTFDNYILSYRTPGQSNYTALGSLPTTDTSYIFSNPTPGIQYEFLLQVVRTGIESSGINSYVSIPNITNPSPPPSTPAPIVSFFQSPTLLMGDASTTHISLSWVPVPDISHPIQQYELFKTIGSASFSSTPYRVFDGSTTSFTDTLIEVDTTYRYYIRAKDIHQSFSGNSNIIQFTPSTSIPESKILPLPALQNISIFPVSFVFHDQNPVDTVELFYSKDGEAYTSYEVLRVVDSMQSGKIIFDVTKTGGEGRYTFYTVAKNVLGFSEQPPFLPDTTTTIDLTPPPLPEALLQLQYTPPNDFLAKIFLQDPHESVTMIIGATLNDELEESSSISLRVEEKWLSNLTLLYKIEGLKPISITYVDEARNKGPTLFLEANFKHEEKNISPVSQDTSPSPDFEVDILHASSQDSDGDGVSDMKEAVIYHTSPNDPLSTPTSLDVFTTNIVDGLTIHTNTQIPTFGAVASGKEVLVYLKNKEGLLFVGSTNNTERSLYRALLELPSTDGIYDMIFEVKDTLDGTSETYIRKNIRLISSPYHFIPEFLKIGETNIQETAEAQNTQQKIEYLSRHQHLELSEHFSSNQIRIEGQILHTTQKTPYKVWAIWDTPYPEGDGYIAVSSSLQDNSFFIESPLLSIGHHTLHIYAQDKSGTLSLLRSLSFTRTPTISTSLHSATMSTCTPFLPFACLLWIIVAFFMGFLMCTLLFQHKKVQEKDEQEKPLPSETEKETKIEAKTMIK